MRRGNSDGIPFKGTGDAAAEIFGRIASLAVLIEDLIAMRDVDVETVVEAVESVAARIGALADMASEACGDRHVYGETNEWCFSSRELKAIAALKQAASAPPPASHPSLEVKA